MPGRAVGHRAPGLRARVDPNRTARREHADRGAAVPAGQRGPGRTMSDSTVAEQVWALPGALWRLRPEACGLLTALNERVWRGGDPALLELVRVRVAQLIGNPAAARCALAGTGVEARLAALPDYPSSPLFSAAERDVVFLAEQFVIDVGGT